MKAIANDKPIEVQLTISQNQVRVNEILEIQDHKFQIIEMYEMNYFQRNFAIMQKKYPSYQFVVKDNQLIIVAKEII